MLTTTVNKAILDGNGATTVWPYTFPIPDTASLVVTYTDADGAETVLGTSLFSVTGIGTITGGNVTYPLSGSAIASGTKLTIQRIVAYTQETNLENQGGYYPDVVEAALDLLTMEIQQLKEKVDRAFVTPVTDVAPDAIVEDAAARANTALLFDADGNPYAGAQVSGTSGASSFMINTVFPASTAAAARTAFGLGTASLLNTTALMLRPGGRLTLATGVPVMISAQTSKTTIFYTPYVNGIVPIYDGTQFTPTAFAELSNITTNSATGSAGPAAVANNSNYDLFVWSNAGTLTLTRGPLWTSDTGRGTGAGTTELVRTNGVLLNTVAITNGPAASRGTYVGTVRSDGSAQCNWQPGAVAAGGTAALLNVWNAYNRVDCRGLVGDSGDNWTLSSATIRAANNSTGNRVSFVVGLQEDFFVASYAVRGGINGTMRIGIGLDVVNAFTGRACDISNNTASITAFMHAQAERQLLGFHFMSACEVSDGSNTATWYGDNGTTAQMMGLHYQGWF